MAQTTNVGHMSAWSLARSRGYTGTREEYAELMASYATVAEQAAESAQSASSSAQGASQAASSANAAMNNALTAESNAQSAASGAQGYAQSAQQSAQSASQSAQNAESAKETAVDAVDGFAAGAQQALESVNSAGINWKSLAEAQKLDSEAWAIGTRGGEDVGSSDPAYHNNAKYYAGSVSASAQTATDAAQTATTKAGEAAASASAAAESARTLTIDSTLTQSGQAADSKVVGDKFEEITSNTKNLFDSNWLLEANGWTEQDGVYVGTVRSLFDEYKTTARALPFEGFESGVRYTFSLYAKLSGNVTSNHGLRLIVTYTDSTDHSVVSVPNATQDFVKFTGTTLAGKTVSAVNVSYGDGLDNTLYLKEVQCEVGIRATDFSPYITAEDSVAREAISNINAVLAEISGETLTEDSAVAKSYIKTNGEIQSGYNDYAIYYYSVPEKSLVKVAGSIKGYGIAVVSVWDSTKTTMKRVAYTSSQNTQPLAYDVNVELDTDEVLAVTQYVSSLATIKTSGAFDIDIAELTEDIEALDNFDQPNFIPPDGTASSETQTTPDFAVLEGKTVNAVGDSITSGNYFRNGVASRLGVTVRNNGVASCTIAINNTYLQNKSIVERVCGLNGNTAIQDADIWIIMGGLNDVYYDSPIGTIESTGTETVYGALKAICENIRSRANNPKLILMTPTQSSRDNSKMRNIVKAVKNVAKLYACPVIDLYNESGICHANIANVLSDSVHPNIVGSSMLVSAISSGIIRNC